MATDNRDNLPKPDFMTEEQFEWLKKATASLDQIRGDAKADVERYKANPDGWSTGAGSPSGLPTLLLTTLGRKSGEKRTTPLVFLQWASTWSSSARWPATIRTRPGTRT